jgi:hypothetical protein
MLKYYQKRFTVKIFNHLVDFETIVDNNVTSYYAVDYGAGKIIRFNENWEFLSIKTLAGCFIKLVENEFFISSDSGILKTDKDLNILKTFSSGTVYRGLYYNESSKNIFVVKRDANLIEIFNKNLTLLDSISTGSYPPFGLNGYKNELFVGTRTGNILVIQNQTITKVYNTLCSGDRLPSFLFDNNGYMSVQCYGGTSSHIYHINGTYMNISLPTATVNFGMKIDSKGRLIATSATELNIFY